MNEGDPRLVCVDTPSALKLVVVPGVFLAVGGSMIVHALRPDSFPQEESHLAWIGLSLGCLMIATAIGIFLHSFRGRYRRITVRFDDRTIEFENFRFQRALALRVRRTPHLRIDFDQLLEAQVLHSRGGEVLFIITTHGRVSVGESATQFESLTRALQGIARDTPPAPAIYSPSTYIAVTAGVTFAIFGVFILGIYRDWWGPVLKLIGY